MWMLIEISVLSAARLCFSDGQLLHFLSMWKRNIVILIHTITIKRCAYADS